MSFKVTIVCDQCGAEGVSMPWGKKGYPWCRADQLRRAKRAGWKRAKVGAKDLCPACQPQQRPAPIEKVCTYCGKSFVCDAKDGRQTRRRFCNSVCKVAACRSRKKGGKP